MGRIHGLHTYTPTVKNVFLNGELREGMVCHLRCSLYGFKQAPRAWFQRFAFVVIVAGFFASAHDPALFVHISSRGRTLLLLYVDDMIITRDDPQFIAFVKAHLGEQFLMSDLSPFRYFLGIEVSSTRGDLLDHASISDHRTDETPMELNVHLSATDGEPLDDPTHYRHIIDKKQTTVSRSSTEAELCAMALVTAEVTWLRWLFADFGVSVSIPTPFLTDITGAISIARDPVKHEVTKHIGVDAYYTRAQVQDSVVTLRYLSKLNETEPMCIFVPTCSNNAYQNLETIDVGTPVESTISEKNVAAID
ncbi:hypothetical protein U9M48_036095 [Paspalum notatum var. saurae]|uniref:Reverse transcriptase Ty1/copia-type domain-containing protein n=1 Tax=Paspalum notatum var. saurae TaxID=547442 RepID=A0AAQ3UCU4_PASNO